MTRAEQELCYAEREYERAATALREHLAAELAEEPAEEYRKWVLWREAKERWETQWRYRLDRAIRAEKKERLGPTIHEGVDVINEIAAQELGGRTT